MDGDNGAAMRVFWALILGMGLTLAVRGYQFGQSNHGVYLLDALRRTDPTLLQRDWFTTGTLQYHLAFGTLAGGLMRIGCLEAGFVIGYVLLVGLMHVAWLRLVLALGGSLRAYLVSVALFYLCFGGTGLGFYHFMQDSAFLPSNIASVALLWGIVLWVTGRPIASAGALGLAGLFHLNHALVALGLWAALALWRRSPWRIALAGGALVLGLSAPNLVPALFTVAQAPDGLPLAEFVDLYVRLRHPHHYDPSAWPIVLWAAFALPAGAFVWLSRGRNQTPWLESRRICVLILALQVVALVGAGVWYVSPTLVHLSLYRFSIYAMLLGCVAGGIALAGSVPRSAWVAPVLLAGVLGYGACQGRLGVYAMPRDDAEYLEVCGWARQHTPADSVFLVPPDEQSFRLHARRAIVVDFKGVPQLGAELPQWRDRLMAVLDLPDLRGLPTPMPRTLAAIRARYDALEPSHLLDVAQRYEADYLLATRRLDDAGEPVYRSSGGMYFLYRLMR